MALRFSGSSGNYLSLSSPPSMSSFTALGWAKLSVDRNALSTIFVYERSDPFSYVDIGFRNDGTTLQIRNDTNETTLLSLAVGDIFFWALTCSGAGTNTLKGYAAKAGSTSLSFAERNVAAIGSTNTYCRLGDNAYSEPLNGFIDNVILYDSVLTRGEIESHWVRRFPIKTPYTWLTCINSQATYTDASGNGRDWSLTGSALTVEDGAPISWGGAITSTSAVLGVKEARVSWVELETIKSIINEKVSIYIID